MTQPRLAARLTAGETVICGWSALGSPLVAETMARAGYDAVCVDQQHGFYDYDAAREAIAAVDAAGAASVARVPVDAPDLIGRMLDIGAEMVIAPMINTADDAAALADVANFPPVGSRSWGPFRLQQLWGWEKPDVLARANDVQLVFAMIETGEAMANIDAIAATDGIDGLFVGPNDLSISLSDGAVVDPVTDAVAAALPKIVMAARDNGKVAGIFANSVALARDYAALGYRFIACGTDSGHIATGSASVLNGLNGD